MAVKAIFSTVTFLLAWTFLSEQLIVHLPRNECQLLNPVAGPNWLQFVGRYEPVDFVTRLALSRNEMWMWPAAVQPWRKTLIAVSVSNFFRYAYNFCTMTREQDARCIILSILLSMKLFALFTSQLPLIDVMLVVAVFWVMAGCPMACLARVEKMSEDFKKSMNAIKAQYEGMTDKVHGQLKRQHKLGEDSINKFQMAYDQYEKRVAELEVSDRRLAKALKTEVMALMQLVVEHTPASGAAVDQDHVDNDVVSCL